MQPDDETWRAKAACLGNPNPFFPGNRDLGPRKAAIATCEGCPVRLPCLQYAMSQPVNMPGVWGGTTHLERKRMRTNARANAAELSHRS